MLCKGAPCPRIELPVRRNAYFLGSCPGCVEACETWGVHQYLLNETLWKLEVAKRKDALGPNLSLGTFKLILIICFGFMLNQTIFELDGVIFYFINEENHDRAVAVG